MVKRNLSSLGGDLRDPVMRQKSMAYQGVVEAVGALLLCLGAGYLADEHWQSSPAGVVTGLLIGFSAFVLRLVRLGHAWSEQLQESEESSEQTASGALEKKDSGDVSQPE